MSEEHQSSSSTADIADLKIIKRRVGIVFLIVGLLFFAYQLADTWRRVKQLESEGNFTAAESVWNHFIFPSIGVLGGIGLALLLRWLFRRLIHKARAKKI
jgi:hypothetical protein